MSQKIKLISSRNYKNLAYDESPEILDKTSKTIDKAMFNIVSRTSGKEVKLKIYREGLYPNQIKYSDRVREIMEFVTQNCATNSDKLKEIQMVLEAATTKNQITLNESAIDKLIEYLSCYSPIKSGAKHFMEIDGANASLIKAIQESEIASNEDFLSIFNELIKKTDSKQIAESIIKSDLSYVDIQKILEIKKKEDSLKEFRERLENKDLKEDRGDNHWQGWFEKNKWLFGSEYVKILNQRTLDEDDTTDFLAESYGGFLEIIEIKVPNLTGEEIFANNTIKKQGKTYIHYYPKAKLTQAISQCLRYISKVERKPDDSKKYENCKILKPRCVLLFGRSNNFNSDEDEALRIINSHYNNFSIITYDQLLERAERSLKSFCSEDDLSSRQGESDIFWEDEEVPF